MAPLEPLKEKKRAPVRRQKTWRNLALDKRKTTASWQWMRNSKTPPKAELRRFKPQAEANSSSKGYVGHACETGNVDRQKHEVVAYGCEKAEHHLNPSLKPRKHKGRHGRQQCKMCIHMKHAKQRTHTRLKRRREKVAEAKVAKVLQEVRAEIQQRQRKQRAQGEESAKGAKAIGPSPTGRKRAPAQICEPEKHIQVEGTEPPRGEEAERSQYVETP